MSCFYCGFLRLIQRCKARQTVRNENVEFQSVRKGIKNANLCKLVLLYKRKKIDRNLLLSM